MPTREVQQLYDTVSTRDDILFICDPLPAPPSQSGSARPSRPGVGTPVVDKHSLRDQAEAEFCFGGATFPIACQVIVVFSAGLLKSLLLILPHIFNLISTVFPFDEWVTAKLSLGLNHGILWLVELGFLLAWCAAKTIPRIIPVLAALGGYYRLPPASSFRRPALIVPTIILGFLAVGGGGSPLPWGTESLAAFTLVMWIGAFADSGTTQEIRQLATRGIAAVRTWFAKRWTGQL